MKGIPLSSTGATIDLAEWLAGWSDPCLKVCPLTVTGTFRLEAPLEALDFRYSSRPAYRP